MESAKRSQRLGIDILAVLVCCCPFFFEVDLFGLSMHLAANQRMVDVTVSAVVTVSNKDTVERGSSGGNEVQLVPVTEFICCAARILWIGLEKNVLVMQRSW